MNNSNNNNTQRINNIDFINYQQHPDNYINNLMMSQFLFPTLKSNIISFPFYPDPNNASFPNPIFFPGLPMIYPYNLPNILQNNQLNSQRMPIFFTSFQNQMNFNSPNPNLINESNDLVLFPIKRKNIKLSSPYVNFSYLIANNPFTNQKEIVRENIKPEIDRMIENDEEINRKNLDLNKILNYLPISIYSNRSGKEFECIICQEKIKQGEEISSLPCIHIFHTTCILPWIIKKNKCPLCGVEVNLRNLIGEEYIKEKTEEKKKLKEDKKKPRRKRNFP